MEKWVYGGAGLARPEGRAALVPFVLPGEQVLVKVVREKTSMLEGLPQEILSPAPERIAPACPYFTHCGGCHYQHAPYEFQVARKVEILREVLRRVGKFDAPAEIAALSGEPWHYRNRTQFHVRGAQIGFLAAGSHQHVPVERCPISAPRINEALTVLRKAIKDRRWPRFVKEIELFTNGDAVMMNVLDTEGGRRLARGFFDWMAESIPGANVGAIEYPTEAGPFRVSHDSFFQVNRFLIDSLVENVTSGLAGDSALDLYAGVGLFSLPLAKAFARVDAVETSASSVDDLVANAEARSVTVHGHRMQAEQYLENLKSPPDVVVADPPRSGLGKRAAGHLLRLAPPKIVIVSCDPATLARDMAAFLAAGYAVTGMTVVDLFPQTYHIETVVRLDRTSA